MIALISPAKTMHCKANSHTNNCSQPRFLAQTQHILSLMMDYSSAEIKEMFKISGALAVELKSMFNDLTFDNSQGFAAIDCYNGVVYKHFKSENEFQRSQQDYLQKTVRISSLLYGLLRPLDLIKPYRMEGFIRLSDNDQRVDQFWRDIQTQTLIDDVNKEGGTLLYLASKEEQNAFHWKEVKKKVRVIDFQFLQYKGEKLRQVVVYTKMARGEMIRYMLEHKINNPEDLKTFEWSGYRYNERLSTEDVWTWVMD